MASPDAVTQSEEQDDTYAGLLFRVGIRCGAIVFAAVLVLAVFAGMDPGLALFRALVALLALAGCGWGAEKLAKIKREVPSEPEPADHIEEA